MCSFISEENPQDARRAVVLIQDLQRSQTSAYTNTRLFLYYHETQFETQLLPAWGEKVYSLSIPYRKMIDLHSVIYFSTLEKT
jgi:hypothetical protein